MSWCRFSRAAVGFALLSLVACTATVPQTPAAIATCPPDRTEVPFAKVMNTTFVSSYEGCNILTRATFVGSGTASMGLGGIENTYPMIRAVAPGEPMPSGLQSPNFIALSPGIEDVAFNLRAGDPIVLTGGTRLNPQVPALSVFIATSISKDVPPPSKPNPKAKH
jgi:hypothetical protein